MTETIAEKLRAAFPADHIGKLPRVTCGKCSDRNNRAGTCDDHPRKEKCAECKAWVSPKHIHIDYVGHADVTSRLLEADPEWNWEPAATDEHGLPVLDTDDKGSPVGMWIRLTVGGVTRLGYGSCPGNQSDAVKVLIGDALRNAAMRFGVALDLWAKGDRADPTAENATASGGQAQRRRPQQPRNGQQANGQVSRPAEQRQQPVPDNAPIDSDAQAIADEAHLARTTRGITDLHKKAVSSEKLNAVVASPSTGGKGTLGPYLNWRRQQIQAEEKAVRELQAAGKTVGLEGDVLDERVRELTGKKIEEASLSQLKEATAKVAAQAGAPA